MVVSRRSTIAGLPTIFCTLNFNVDLLVDRNTDLFHCKNVTSLNSFLLLKMLVFLYGTLNFG